MLMRFDPFRELDRMTQQVWGGNERPSVLPMPMDAYRDGDQFVVRLDLPGIEPDSIDLTVERNVVTVSATRSWRRDGRHEVIVAERPQGMFRRQLFLGEGLDSEGLSASYEQGVLTVTLPVAEQAKPRKVEISGSTSGAALIDATSSEGADDDQELTHST